MVYERKESLFCKQSFSDCNNTHTVYRGFSTLKSHCMILQQQSPNLITWIYLYICCGLMVVLSCTEHDMHESVDSDLKKADESSVCLLSSLFVEWNDKPNSISSINGVLTYIKTCEGRDLGKLCRQNLPLFWLLTTNTVGILSDLMFQI